MGKIIFTSRAFKRYQRLKSRTKILTELYEAAKNYAGFTQAQLADARGVNRQAQWIVENFRSSLNGETIIGLSNTDTLFSIAYACKLEITFRLEGSSHLFPNFRRSFTLKCRSSTRQNALTLAKFFQTAMEFSGLKEKELAKKSGLTVEHIRQLLDPIPRIAEGKPAMPNLDTLIRFVLANRLELKLALRRPKRPKKMPTTREAPSGQKPSRHGAYRRKMLVENRSNLY